MAPVRRRASASGEPRPAASPPLSHFRARILASKAWDGEPARDEAARLKAHVAWCEECAVWDARMSRFLGRLERALGRIVARRRSR